MSDEHFATDVPAAGGIIHQTTTHYPHRQDYATDSSVIVRMYNNYYYMHVHTHLLRNQFTLPQS